MNKLREFYAFNKKLKSIKKVSDETFIDDPYPEDRDKKDIEDLVILWKKWRNASYDETCFPEQIEKEELELIKKIHFEITENSWNPFGKTFAVPKIILMPFIITDGIRCIFRKIIKMVKKQ